LQQRIAAPFRASTRAQYATQLRQFSRRSSR
jgi:hypothetical protein